MLERGAAAARFPLALAGKDAELVVAAARAAEADVRLAATIRSWFADAEAAGLGPADYTAVLHHIVGRR